MLLELEMPITDEIRRQLKAWLAKDGSNTLYKAAKATGVSWQTLSRFVDGKPLLSDHLDAIAEYLNIGVTTPAATPARKTPPRKRPPTK